MELKSLLLGLAFSLGIFAVKSGAGLASLIQQETGPKRWVILCCCQASYLLSFLLAWFLIRQGNLMEHLEEFMLFLQNGMTLHCLLAALLLLWGSGTFKTATKKKYKKLGLDIVLSGGKSDLGQGQRRRATPWSCLPTKKWFHGVCPGKRKSRH